MIYLFLDPFFEYPLPGNSTPCIRSGYNAGDFSYLTIRILVSPMLDNFSLLLVEHFPFIILDLAKLRIIQRNQLSLMWWDYLLYDFYHFLD